MAMQALLHGAAAVLLVAGTWSGMQWLLARVHHEPLDYEANDVEAANDAPARGH